MPDRPGTPLEKYYALRTQAIAKGAAFDSEEMKRSVCTHFVLNGMRSDNPQLDLVRRQPVEVHDASPERKALLRALDPTETAVLERAKAEAEAATLQANAQQLELAAVKDEMAALRAMNADLLSRLTSAAGPQPPAPLPAQEAKTGSGDAPAGFVPPPSSRPDPVSIQALPPLDTYREALADVPAMSWTKAKLLMWAEGKGIAIPEELEAAGTKADIVEHLLEHSSTEE